MVGSNKILTVSYGTFSCTLEGFDDSFDMMKAIAEYFRDLAADDRYFGAEPPTPDAETLARIAERQSSRRIEAYESAGGLVLRPAPSMPSGTMLARPAEPAADPGPASDADGAMPDTPESVAAKLSRIRAAVARGTAADSYSEDEHAEESPAPAAGEAEVRAEDNAGDGAEAAPPAPAAAAEGAVAETAAGPGDASPAEQDSAGPAQDDPHEASPERRAPAREEPSASDAVASHAKRTSEAEEPPAAPRVAPAPSAAANVADAVAAEEAALAAERSEDSPQAGAAASADASETDEEPAEPIAAEFDGDDLDDMAEDDTAEDETVEHEDGEQADAAPSVHAESSAGVGREDTVAPRPARILKVKRADLERALSSGTLERLTDEDAEEDGAFPLRTPRAAAEEDEDLDLDLDAPEPAESGATPADRPSTLSREQEEDLLRELAALEAEDAGGTESARRAERPASPPRGEEPAIRRAAVSPTGEVDVERLIAATNAELQKPESSRRREAIAHLKAAVAATEAARRMGEDETETGGDGEAYREDLRDAVATGPRRPSQRPRPGPLKLVAAQRVDIPAVPAEAPAETQGVVRPRRVSAAQDAAVSEQEEGSDRQDRLGQFAAFAEARGVQDLPDVLEAVAAFLTQEEGLETFGRPRVIGLLRDHLGADFSREAGLRAFGTLLRERRIERTEDGQFSLGRASQFAEGTRRAG